LENDKSILDFSIVRKKLYSAVLADILDDLGFRSQAMNHTIRPINPSFKVMGRAFTILATDVYEVSDFPYEKELEAVDHLKKDDVVVATTNGSTSSGFWGELLSTAAQVKEARGGIIDGLTRDSSKIIEMDFPLFARGFSPYDSKGRTDVIAYKVPVQCGGVTVNTGDIVFGDQDGIVVIPEQVSEIVIEKALQKVDGEDEMRKALLEGMGVVEAFNKFKIL
jgi:4-hydroxy-4-methyl-2-oxoglutarate aldolase